MTKQQSYAVLITEATVYVKEWNFFKQQGGLTESWGRHWVRIRAKNIEDARRRGFVRRDGRKIGNKNYARVASYTLG